MTVQKKKSERLLILKYVKNKKLRNFYVYAIKSCHLFYLQYWLLKKKTLIKLKIIWKFIFSLVKMKWSQPKQG
jgi:hypothetical protein